MRIRFTKMHGAGNDFVVLDETRGRLGLRADQYRFLADRHFGVGADQILTVRPSTGPGVDFEYVIHNADGGEVEQCGNGARCFFQYVREHGLTDKAALRVHTAAGVIAPSMGADGRVTVDMGPPVFEAAQVPFDAAGLSPQGASAVGPWKLALGTEADSPTVELAVLSMGNPHAVQRVDDVDTAPVAEQGPLVEHHPRFPNRVNAGFLQVLDRRNVKLRVHERGAGETLACGTGACAAVVGGIQQGWLDSPVDVQTRGGVLTIAWEGLGTPVRMTGPAQTVFEGEIDIPE
ncbi:diaminopimelate epimerase [Pseudorhodoferax sp. Leaf265]|uniref:diaminopimelate epimerase n=1 Tax=Pseudorhodoferax sp. Leaf265 TaxID=1736315 RepID=UPI0006FCF6BB|nr:diaminopimelate epimerase [Pseudorhodoferax sp. Leaf265]KQP16138.1 diaminopimelate epimerase [Pseudorhodoferax sp. Leaf265]